MIFVAPTAEYNSLKPGVTLVTPRSSRTDDLVDELLAPLYPVAPAADGWTVISSQNN